MATSAKALQEKDRLESLRSYDLMEGVSEQVFDEITRMAAKLFKAPIAFLSVVEEKRLWFKSSIGVPVTEVDRELTFCNLTIQQKEVFVVEDATLHPALKSNPFVTGGLKVRFYAGAPVLDQNGQALGAVCIIDTVPRQFSADERELLSMLSIQAMAQLSVKKLDREVRVRSHGIEQAPVAMFLLDRLPVNRPILYANPAFSVMTGYSPEESRGMSIFALRGKDTDETEILAVRKALIEARPFRTTLKGYRKDQSHFWADATISPVIEHDGSCRYFYVVMDDVTEKKSRDALIVTQQQNLIESQKMAALGRMAAGIAHEINNPLSIIRGRSEILLNETKNGREPSATKVRESTENIMRTVDRIVKIVRGLRGISRSSDADPFISASVADTIGDAIEFSRERCQAKGIELRVPEIPRESRIGCRPEQIVQVLLNLISNAADQVSLGSSPDSHSPSWIQIEFSETPNSVELAVKDSGTGLSDTIRSRLFEPFATTKEIGQGVGLGLFISKNIVESHFGNLRIDSESENTRFVILLPRDPEILRKTSHAS